MKQWFWYLRKHNEIFCDFDGDPHKRAAYAHKLHRAKRRLHGLIDSGLSVSEAFLFSSSTRLHHHLIITLGFSISTLNANILALYIGSDVYRACNNLKRINVHPNIENAADLLISPIAYGIEKQNFRVHDFTCNCEAKHTRPIMEACPVARRIRGKWAAHDFFAKPATVDPWTKTGRIYPCE